MGAVTGGVRPSAGWHLLSVVLVVAGSLMFVVSLVDELRTLDERVVSIGSDGVGAVDLAAGSTPKVWAEYPVPDGDDVRPPDVRIQVRDPAGSVVEARDVRSRITWSNGATTGVAVAAFTAAERGRYVVEVRPGSDDGFDSLPQSWSVGDLDVVGTIWRVGRWLLALPAAIALSVVVTVMRVRSRRRIASGQVGVIATTTDTWRAPPPHGGPFS